MNSIEKKQTQRFLFLNHLYDLADGDSFNSVPILDVADSCKIAEKEADSLANYLDKEGLLEYATMGADRGPTLRITHSGVVEIEEARLNPGARTEHFPPLTIINNIHQMIGSQLQQGNAGSVQVQHSDIGKIEDSFNELFKAIESCNGNTTEKELAKSYLTTLQSQARIPADYRDRSIVQFTLEKLGEICTLLTIGDYFLKLKPYVMALIP